MTSRGRAAAVAAVKAVSVATDPLFGKLPGPRILIYHDVAEDSSSAMSISPQTLEEQIDWLSNRGSIVPLAEAIARRSDPDAAMLSVLTFDDGHRGLYDQAWGMLLRRRVPFTLYLNTAPIVGDGPPRPGSGPMKWDEVNEMVESGLATVGSHTHTHIDLRTAAVEVVKKELRTANDLLRDNTGVDAKHFAYPWGYWSKSADGVVRNWFDSAVLGSGPGIAEDQDPYLLSRIPIQRSDTQSFFRAKIRGGMRLEDKLRRVVKRYRGP